MINISIYKFSTFFSDLKILCIYMYVLCKEIQSLAHCDTMDRRQCLAVYATVMGSIPTVTRRNAAAQHNAMPPDFGGKYGTECPNTKFSLSTLLCARYSVKLIITKIYFHLRNFPIIQHKLCKCILIQIILRFVRHCHCFASTF